MTCIIVDDEPLSLDLLEQYIAEVPDLELVARCPDAFEALEAIRMQSPDLLFADINMPRLSGISLVRALKNPPMIVFTTAYPEYAAEGFELDALDYLVKPISFERFMRTVAKAKRALESPSQVSHGNLKEPAGESLTVKVDRKHYRIPLCDIRYIQAWGDFAKVHLQNGTLLASASLKQIEQELPSERFLRIHKSYLISVEQVKYLDGNQVCIADELLPVGASYRDAVLLRLHIRPT